MRTSWHGYAALDADPAVYFVSGIIRRHRVSIGSRWRKLNSGQQGLLVLAYLRKGETFAGLAAGFGVGVATAWRYVNETVALLAARTPKLRTAIRDANKAGHAYVVLDGTLIPIDRLAADRPFYSGKHQKHGMNLQVIASPGGDIVWVSGRCPARCTTSGPSGSGACWTSWRKPAWSPSCHWLKSKLPGNFLANLTRFRGAKRKANGARCWATEGDEPRRSAQLAGPSRDSRRRPQTVR
jgi:Helix-turn-helix of DDE superfamily endonuclease/DDE superfamily endonuclease